MTAARSEREGAPSATGKILILWAIVFAASLAAVLVCLRPLTEFVFDNSPYNYVKRGREFLENDEPAKALEYLSGALYYLPSTDEPSAYRLIADSWMDLGDAGRHDLWISRARFQEAWLQEVARSPSALEERWGDISDSALQAIRYLDADVTGLSPEWSERLLSKMLYERAREGAEIDEWVASRPADENLGLLLAGGARLLVGVGVEPVRSGVYLQGAGFDQGKGAVILAGGTVLVDTEAPGYHVVALDPEDGRPMAPQQFNTYADRDADDRMAQYLQNLPQDWVVLIAVSDEAAKLADPQVIEKGLKAVGIELPAFRLRTRHLGYREPFVGVGVRGKKGACVLAKRWGRPAFLVALPRKTEDRATSEPDNSTE